MDSLTPATGKTKAFVQSLEAKGWDWALLVTGPGEDATLARAAANVHSVRSENLFVDVCICIYSRERYPGTRTGVGKGLFFWT